MNTKVILKVKPKIRSRHESISNPIKVKRNMNSTFNSVSRKPAFQAPKPKLMEELIRKLGTRVNLFPTKRKEIHDKVQKIRENNRKRVTVKLNKQRLKGGRRFISPQPVINTF